MRDATFHSADEHQAAFEIVRCMQGDDGKPVAYLRRIFRVFFMPEEDFDKGVEQAKVEGWITTDGALTEAGQNAFPEYMEKNTFIPPGPFKIRIP